MTAINGAVLLAALILAGAVILAAAIRREAKRLPGHVEQALAQPAPATSSGGHIRQCDGPCRRRIYLPFGDPNVALWICTRCTEHAIAQLEKDFAS